jgi:hypothetical protein
MANEWVASTRLNVNRVMALGQIGQQPGGRCPFQTADRARPPSASMSCRRGLEASVESEKGRVLLTEIAQRRKEYIDVQQDPTSTRWPSGDEARADTLLMTGPAPGGRKIPGDHGATAATAGRSWSAKPRSRFTSGISQQLVLDSVVSLVADPAGHRPGLAHHPLGHGTAARGGRGRQRRSRR